MTNIPYVSMIKINGTPILPPMIEDSERPALRRYRDEAIMVEKKLAERALKQREIISENQQPLLDMSECSSLSNIDTVQVMNFIRQALKDSAHLEEVRHLQEVIQEELLKYQGGNSLAKYDSMDTLHNIDDLSNALGPSSLEVSLSNPKSCEKSSSSQELESMIAPKTNNALVNPETNSQVESISPCIGAEGLVEPQLTLNYPPIPLIGNYTISHSNGTGNLSESGISVEESPPNRIRRNSYTLESPSPSVLLYLKSLNIDDNTSFSSNTSCKNVKRNLNQVWADVMSPSVHSTPANNSNISWMSDTESAECDATENSICFPSETNHPDKMNDKNTNHLPISKNDNSISTDEAATKIQAAVRGYLTRRLLKTNRIIDLKNAIKDSLIAALQIHTDISTSKAEIDLHHALTMQIESLCNEWHQIFFDYTPEERMKIIQVDRIKRKNPKNERLLVKTKNGVGPSITRPGNMAVRPKSLSIYPRSNATANIKKCTI